MISETLKATGALEIIVIEESGNIRDTINVPNMVVDLGKNFIVSRMNTSPPTAMSHMAIGGNDTSTTASMTTLVSEALSSGTSGSKIRTSVTTTVTGNSIKYSATFPANSPSTAYTVKEAGIFNSVSTGTMLARTTFGAVQKNTTDTIVINWTITIN
jgi:hypothetical protein